MHEPTLFRRHVQLKSTCHIKVSRARIIDHDGATGEFNPDLHEIRLGMSGTHPCGSYISTHTPPAQHETTTIPAKGTFKYRMTPSKRLELLKKYA